MSNTSKEFGNFIFKTLELSGAFLITPKVFEDERGIFFVQYEKEAFRLAGIEEEFLQSNCSISKQNVIRGLHYQKAPYEQAKLVRVTAGKIIDTIIDMRRGSKTFGKSLSVELSADNLLELYVPKGFAHGFQVTQGPAMVEYMVSNKYSLAHEAGIRWNDNDLGITWRNTTNAIISEKDQQWPFLREL